MKINRLKLRNYLSVADEPIDIDFTKYGNIVNIKGRNLDAGEGASNSSGKTTVCSGIIYALYGKLIKNLSHKEIVNSKTKKNLEVSLDFSVNDNDYKIVRRRLPNELELWHNGKNVSLGGIPATDEEIKRIIKLNYDSFVNVFYFGQHNVKSFLNCSAQDKRTIAENLLALDKYTRYCKNAKDKLKDLKEKTISLSATYESSLQELSNIKKKAELLMVQGKQWKQKNQENILNLDKQISEKEMQLLSLKSDKDVEDYEKIQEELLITEEQIAIKEESKSQQYKMLEKVDNVIQQRREEQQKISIENSAIDRELKILEIELSKEKNHEEKMICSECQREYPKEDVKQNLERRIAKIKELQSKWQEVKEKKEIKNKELSVCAENLQKLLEGKKALKNKELENLSLLNSLFEKKKRLIQIKKPDIMAEVKLINKDIDHMKEKKESLLKEENPYTQMLEMTRTDIDDCLKKANKSRSDLKSLEVKIPYHNFWVDAFGDHGIRSFVLSSLIPALNSRINYWLQYLMDGKIQFHFDNDLNEKIERLPIDKDPFVYNSLSGGDIVKIDLAISQAFAHLTTISAGICPNMTIFDEIGNNVDRPGIHSLFNMITELSREKQVFVISHDVDLMNLLDNYDTIVIEKKNGISRVVK